MPVAVAAGSPPPLRSQPAQLTAPLRAQPGSQPGPSHGEPIPAIANFTKTAWEGARGRRATLIQIAVD